MRKKLNGGNIAHNKFRDLKLKILKGCKALANPIIMFLE